MYWWLAIFMLLTVARVGEACGLKWDAVDLEENIVRVIRRVCWDQQTKHFFLEEMAITAQSVQVLTLPERFHKTLPSMKKKHLSDCVFTDKKGKLLKYNAIQANFNADFIA